MPRIRRGPGRTSYAYRKARARVLAQSRECWLCGSSDPPANSVDHVIPLSVLLAAGMAEELADAESNLRPAHLICNQRRGNRAPFTKRDDGGLGTPSQRW